MALWQRGVHEIPECRGDDEVCSMRMIRLGEVSRKFLPVLKHRGGVSLREEERMMDAMNRLGPDFEAALALNEAEHKRDCEKSCESFFCGDSSREADDESSAVVATRAISMGSVPPEDFASAFHYPLDLIRVTSEPVLSAREASEVIANARAENVDGNVFTSGKYKLGGDWLNNLNNTRTWFNGLLERKIFPNLASSFPEVVTNSSTLRAHSVALLKYNSTHPRTDVHVDNGIIALTLAMSPKSDYEGGGTFFEHLGEEDLVEMDVGEATWRPGSVRHGGHRVTSGERYILGAFFLLSDRVEHVRRLKNRGSELRSNGDVEGAVKHFKWALEINPTCSTCMKDLAEAYVATNALDEAEKWLRASLDLLPRDSDALFSLGVVLSKRGDDAGALEVYRDSARVNSDDAELLYNLGIKLQQVASAGDEERKMYQRALKVDPGFNKARCNLGASLAEAGLFEDAEPHLVQAAADPDVALTALQNLAVLYENRAQATLAGFKSVSSKAQAVRVAADAEVHLTNAHDAWDRILTLAKTGDPSLENTATSRLANLLKTRGRIVAISGDIPKALALLEKATKLAPRDVGAWQALEKAAQIVGDSAKAAEARAKIDSI